ncbi:FGGY family carbohydrate kinase [Paenibacillus cymbidii]|uniref:FGGY family carbohydrate kinase n=1 Tax=Paenibacillus cymbidii TaxID=1639034 RepID=UPI00143680CA|nr:FGGY family carbohydrate kinase [Paenibacillus cymbidii]
MDNGLLLAIDQGTTGTKVLLLDRRQAVVSQSYRKHAQYYPQPGWVEHDPLDIWEQVKRAVAEALDGAAIDPASIAAEGLAGQGETALFWDRRTGEPLCRAVVWSCKRSATLADSWRHDADLPERVIAKTGLPIDSYYSATKIRWMANEVPAVRRGIEEGTAVCGTLDSWLIWQMTGGRSFVTDVSTAARTQLFHIGSLQWDEDILAYWRIDRQWLPGVLDSTGDFGMTDAQALCGIRSPIKVSLVDQPAALYGQNCIRPGTASCTYGTGCFVYANIGGELPATRDAAISTMVAWTGNGRIAYAMDGAVLAAGSAIEWACQAAGLFADLAQLQTWSERWVDEWTESATDRETPWFIPSLNGLGAPYWNGETRGVFVGLSFRTDREQMAKAVLEGIAHRVADVPAPGWRASRYPQLLPDAGPHAGNRSGRNGDRHLRFPRQHGAYVAA